MEDPLRVSDVLSGENRSKDSESKGLGGDRGWG